MKTSKNNIALDFIEYEIPEKDLEDFKTAIAQGCIKRVNQLTPAKWYYLLKWEDAVIEVEISFNKKNIKQFHCACGAHSPGKYCKHVLLASYWHVSTIIAKSSTQETYSSLSNKSLSNTSDEDLRYYVTFLGSLNKLNREWIIFFDSARGNHTHPFQKYRLLLSDFERFLESYTRNVASKFKIHLQLFEELYYIAFHHYKKSDIRESIHALLAGIEALHNWHATLDWKYQPRLQNINDKMHNALIQFLSSIVAPNTLGKIRQLILEIIIKDEYVVFNHHANLFKVLQQQFPKELAAVNQFDILIGKLRLIIRDEYKFILLDYLSTSYPDDLVNYLKNNAQSHDLYYSFLTWMDARKKNISPEILIEILPLIYDLSNKEIKIILASKFSELVAKIENREKADLLIRYYLELGKAELLETYFHDKTLEDQEFQSFIDTIAKSAGRIELNHIQKLDLACYAGQWNMLMVLLRQYQDIDWLIQHDRSIPEKYHQEIIGQYISYLNKYLQSHAGQKVNQKLEFIWRHIKFVYKVKLQSYFMSTLKSHFPGRKLINQLH